ncbi:MAG TPA: Ig-like domain-containing protein [Solirubrobacter sp.]|nr:Ig-like domain-containing protein [Solirubrobacter sp.]
MTTVLGAVGCALALSACSGTDSNDPPIGPASRVVISITPKTDTLVPGATRQLSAVATDNGVVQHSPLSWSSSAPSVATVSASGIVSAVAPGIAHIIVRASTTSDSAMIVVRDAAGISVEPSIVSVPFGEQLQLTASAAGNAAAPAGNGVVWSTSDASVATVNESGMVTTTGVGEATLVATAGSQSGSAAISVKPNAVSSIRISPTNSSIEPKATEQLIATLLDDNGRVLPGSPNNWSSSNSAVATVSDDGMVTGVAKGSAIITARLGSKRSTATVNVLAIPVATVHVSAPAASVSVGQTLQASATLRDADGNVLTGRVIAWQSSNPALATVTSTGLITALAIGQVTITAIAEGKLGNLAVAVTSNPVATIAVTPANGSAVLGQTAQLEAVARDAAGATIAGKTFEWRTSDPTIATVSATGLVTTAAVGKTIISASTDGITGSTEFTVTTVPVTSVTVQPGSVQLTVGGTTQLVVSGSDAAGKSIATRTVQWSSDKPAVATVSSAGLVTAVGAGSATITATVDGVSGVAQVTVALPPPAPVASITVSLAEPSISTGQTTQASAVLRDADGNILTGRTVTWSSDDAALATISSSGLVKAVAAGTATIVATAEEQTGLASITIVPAAPAPVASVSLSAPATSLTVGQTTQITVVVRDASGNVLSGRVVSWQSSNTAAATVSANGIVTAVANGSATIKATSEGVSGALEFSVSGGPTVPGPVATISVSTTTSSLTVGQTTSATAVARDADGTTVPNATITWSSSNTGVITVSGSGVVTAIAAGAAQVRATSGAVVGTVGITVTEPAPPPPPPEGPLPVVPGLAGFGVETRAGRGGQVLRVTNLNDGGAGSLRAALAASGPRTIVFEVGGTITLASALSVTSPYVTVAGQTAPAPGVTLRGQGLHIRTNDVLVQHIRIRPGVTGTEVDGLRILGPAYNVVIDHVSASWSSDENFSTSGSSPRDVTIANSISSEAIMKSYGMLIHDSSDRVAVVGTLFAHNADRNPYFKGGTSGVFVNNVVYNWVDGVAYTADPDGGGASQISMVGNAFIHGANTTQSRPMRAYRSTSTATRFYVAGNSLNEAAPPSSPWSLVTNDVGSSIVAAAAPVWPAGLTPLAAGQVVASVLARAGAWPGARDAVDARVVADVRNRTGGKISSPSDVGGWPDLGTPRHALALPASPGADDDRDGYTNLEEWLHTLAARAEGR